MDEVVGFHLFDIRFRPELLAGPGITERLHENDFFHQVRCSRAIDDLLELLEVGTVERVVARHVLDKKNGCFPFKAVIGIVFQYFLEFRLVVPGKFQGLLELGVSFPAGMQESE